jgi:hypothetical protein
VCKTRARLCRTGLRVNFGLGRFAPIYIGPPSFAGLAPGGRVDVGC